MSERVERLRAELDGLEAASFLVTRPVNVLYLTGFDSSNAALVVGRDRPLVATDGRYLEAAKALEGVEVVQAERDLLDWTGARLGELAAAPVAFEADHVTVAGFDLLSQDGTELVPSSGVVARLRAVKDEAELDAIRRAARVTDAAYERLAQEELVGRTEAEVAWWMEQALREEGAEGLAFPVIVGGGPNAALPHHHPGRRKIGSGETVIVDAGAQVSGYCADCTRTFATGTLPDDLRRAYALCHAAQESALAAVRAGATGDELDAIARTKIEESGLALVLHGLGHGVGLEVHEQPVLRPGSTDPLVARNVVTVEPGVYLAGEGGVRIEDLVVVGEGGPEVLSSFTKNLLTLE
ncbi:MAG: M24 family metallopeptidase [Gaiellaceae bacterium]